MPPSALLAGVFAWGDLAGALVVGRCPVPAAGHRAMSGQYALPFRVKKQK